MKNFTKWIHAFLEKNAAVLINEHIFNPDCVEIYLKPTGDYVELDRSVNFYTIAVAGIFVEISAIRNQEWDQVEKTKYSAGFIRTQKPNKVKASENDQVVFHAEG